MTKEETLIIGLHLKLKNLIKQFPNDSDLGREVRKMFIDVESKIKEITENKKG